MKKSSATTLARSGLTRPPALKRQHLVYLDDLRGSGKTNMYLARPYLQREFPALSLAEARAILFYWMETFADRHALPARRKVSVLPARRRIGRKMNRAA